MSGRRQGWAGAGERSTVGRTPRRFDMDYLRPVQRRALASVLREMVEASTNGRANVRALRWAEKLHPRQSADGGE